MLAIFAGKLPLWSTQFASFAHQRMMAPVYVFQHHVLTICSDPQPKYSRISTDAYMTRFNLSYSLMLYKTALVQRIFQIHTVHPQTKFPNGMIDKLILNHHSDRRYPYSLATWVPYEIMLRLLNRPFLAPWFSLTNQLMHRCVDGVLHQVFKIATTTPTGLPRSFAMEDDETMDLMVPLHVGDDVAVYNLDRRLVQDAAQRHLRPTMVPWYDRIAIKQQWLREPNYVGNKLIMINEIDDYVDVDPFLGQLEL